jgi:hypothetical protein
LKLQTQYIYEKRWSKTSTSDALRIISEEMPYADAKGTLDYILSQIKKGRVVTLGECRFKLAT